MTIGTFAAVNGLAHRLNGPFLEPRLTAACKLPGPIGLWRSLVARSLWEREAGGSNPPNPTSPEGYPREGTVWFER